MKASIPYDELDAEIVKLVRLMNSLSFLETDQSDGGRVENKIRFCGYFRIVPPSVLFYIDGKVDINFKDIRFNKDLAKPFLDGLQQICEKVGTGGVKLLKDYDGYNPKPHYYFYTGKVQRLEMKEKAEETRRQQLQLVELVENYTKDFLEAPAELPYEPIITTHGRYFS